MMKKLYQTKDGKPFYLRDIDPLFYACCYLDSDLSFLMEKGKFYKALNNGTITEFRLASNL
ncbi:hypothetical protein BHF71_03415 [Vulcanibacillus modesticaldus]|uniref:Uncharacterized protein n=1 Tax=Vulcanibacillus modesticaldus TaxID=337097 RepID=A0A1D2YSU7_9BACI|nr:hypothetical protein [Vulcanibacillus modesticaldus]OEF98081.1 hypothetical protein BHF71_03415 [Vulcanibacillus modesticaldus]